MINCSLSLAVELIASSTIKFDLFGDVRWSQTKNEKSKKSMLWLLQRNDLTNNVHIWRNVIHKRLGKRKRDRARENSRSSRRRNKIQKRIPAFYFWEEKKSKKKPNLYEYGNTAFSVDRTIQTNELLLLFVYDAMGSLTSSWAVAAAAVAESCCV